jgi:hypothetical protein
LPLDAGYAGTDTPRLVALGGLLDCLTVYPSDGLIDANTAAPAVLAALGLDQATIGALVARRRQKPLNQGELSGFLSSAGVSGTRLRVNGNFIVTFRATARLKIPGGLSDLKRTVGAQVRYQQNTAQTVTVDNTKPPYNVLRWYDTAWSN